MPGGSLSHATLSGNLSGLLFSALRGRDCRVIGSDVLVQSGSKTFLTYPHVMAISIAPIMRDGTNNVVTNPVFVAEVLSPSTEATDRVVKFREYRSTPSIRQYALLSHKAPFIEIHTRHDDGSWRLIDCSGLDAHCEFSSLGCTIPMAELYNGVLE